MAYAPHNAPSNPLLLCSPHTPNQNLGLFVHIPLRFPIEPCSIVRWLHQVKSNTFKLVKSPNDFATFTRVFLLMSIPQAWKVHKMILLSSPSFCNHQNQLPSSYKVGQSHLATFARVSLLMSIPKAWKVHKMILPCIPNFCNHQNHLPSSYKVGQSHAATMARLSLLMSIPQAWKVHKMILLSSPSFCNHQKSTSFKLQSWPKSSGNHGKFVSLNVNTSSLESAQNDSPK